MVVVENVVITVGKGGVGKTTVSILLSLILSDVGNTLLYSLDPAKHLIKYLGVKEPMKYFRIGKTLTAYQLDIDIALNTILDHYVELIRGVSPSLSVLNLDNVVNTIKYSPGVEEEVFMRELEKLFNRHEYRYVVIDTPPTGITLRTLIMPKLYGLWIDKLIEIRERILSLRYSIARTLGREFKIRDPVLEKLYEMREMYKTLWERVRSATTSFVIVANPEVMPLLEVLDVIKFLKKELGVDPKLLVMNKYVESLETADIIEEFNKLPYRKVIVPKVERPPAKLDDVVELSKLVNREEVLNALSGLSPHG
ncbi:MAG: ArsA-related P-loop ATPase [Sulfolobales archaeon]